MVSECTFAVVFPLYNGISLTLIGHFTTCLCVVRSVIMKEVDPGGGQRGEIFPGMCYVRLHIKSSKP